MECASSYLPKAIFQSYHAEKEDIFPYERLHRSLIYYSLPTKASVWLKTTAIFHSLAISGEKGKLLKSEDDIAAPFFTYSAWWQLLAKKSYCHSERSLYKNLVSSSLEESVHLICHWWSKLALSVTTIYQHWTWEPQVPKMADQITKESLSSWSDQTKSKLC